MYNNIMIILYHMILGLKIQMPQPMNNYHVFAIVFAGVSTYRLYNIIARATYIMVYGIGNR